MNSRLENLKLCATLASVSPEADAAIRVPMQIVYWEEGPRKSQQESGEVRQGKEGPHGKRVTEQVTAVAL